MVGDRLLREQQPVRAVGVRARLLRGREHGLEHLGQARRVGREDRLGAEALHERGQVAGPHGGDRGHERELRVGHADERHRLARRHPLLALAAVDHDVPAAPREGRRERVGPRHGLGVQGPARRGQRRGDLVAARCADVHEEGSQAAAGHHISLIGPAPAGLTGASRGTSRRRRAAAAPPRRGHRRGRASSRRWPGSGPARRPARTAPRAARRSPRRRPRPRRPRRPRSSGSASSSTRNSSPPWRASSPSPSSPASRSAMPRSRASPTAWPCESLTRLKPSRSANSSADRVPGAGCGVHGGAQRGVEVRAVRQPGQVVLEREPPDLGLGVQLVRDVLAGGERARRGPVGRVQQRVAPGHRAHLAGGRHELGPAPGLGGRGLAPHRRPEDGPDALALRGGHGDVEPVAADQGAGGVAEQLVPVLVEQAHGLVGVDHEQHRAGDVEVPLGQVALLAQGGLGGDEPLLRGLHARDVEHHAVAEERPAGLVAHDRLALGDPHDAAVGGVHAVLAREVDALGERAPGLRRARARGRRRGGWTPRGRARGTTARAGSRGAPRRAATCSGSCPARPRRRCRGRPRSTPRGRGSAPRRRAPTRGRPRAPGRGPASRPPSPGRRAAGRRAQRACTGKIGRCARKVSEVSGRRGERSDRPGDVPGVLASCGCRPARSRASARPCRSGAAGRSSARRPRSSPATGRSSRSCAGSRT